MPLASHPIQYIIGTPLFLNQPAYNDVLPMYTVFILFSFPALLLLKKQKDILFLFIIALVWGLGQFFNPINHLQSIFFEHCSPGIFNFLSWQIIFFLGIYLGYKDKKYNPAVILESRIVQITIYISIIVLFFSRHEFISLHHYLKPYVNRTDLGWVRIFDFMLIVCVISLFLKKIPKEAKIPWINFLGKHSLQVFTFHIAVIYFIIAPLGMGDGILARFGVLGYCLALICFTASLSIPALVHNSYATRKKQKYKLKKNPYKCNV